MIRTATTSDGAALARVYNPYIVGTTITFEESEVPAEEMAARVSHHLEAGLPWLVWEEQGQVVGYAYAGAWKGRCAYRSSVETSVYIAPDAAGRGLGSQLYRALLPLLEARGDHVVIAGIALPNARSVALHERLGFDKVAHFREVGWKFQRWVDVGYWQLVLPHR